MKPRKCGIVDGLCYVVAEVEATVIAASKDQHELSGMLFDLGDAQLRKRAFEKIRIDEGSLVPEVLAAFAELLREVAFSLTLKQFSLSLRNAVPKFGLSFVEVVDSRQVQVLFVPAE